MATMTILTPPLCKEPDCLARATRRINAVDGKPDGDYCAVHANRRLVELAKQEGKNA